MTAGIAFRVVAHAAIHFGRAAFAQGVRCIGIKRNARLATLYHPIKSGTTHLVRRIKNTHRTLPSQQAVSALFVRQQPALAI